MVAPERVEQAITRIRDQKSFIQDLLIDVLGWPIADSIETLEDISYDWSADELRAEGLDERLVDGRVWQVQPMRSDQPWGVFLLEFRHPDVFTTGRGMTGTLRKVLRGLVPRRRRAANLPSWNAEHILFICTHGWNRFAFARFVGSEAHSARLAFFAWETGDKAIHTLCKHNLPHLEWPETNTPDDYPANQWLLDWGKAWDVSRVTEAFYEAYKAVFDAIKDGIRGLPTKTAGDREQRHLFAQTILSRLIFCYFLQKKGWLNGEARYLQDLALSAREEVKRDKSLDKDHFYQHKLQLLFFEALNTPEEQRASDPAWEKRIKPTLGDVPYLNGGLFERVTEWDNESVTIPDTLLYRVFEELFDPFNFTIEESTPLDQQVALDPEILGHVFEKQVVGRQEKGAYYTSRQVVDYMCRQALLDWLDEHVAVSREKLTELVCDRQVAELSHDEAADILGALRGVMVCDPACGSGAFLVGMMQVLVELRSILAPSQLNEPNAIYKLKLSVIENNIFGADIDPFACGIAMLRLWLSLAVDHEVDEIAQVQPLPNLRFKIRCGDSLVEQINGKRVNSLAGQTTLDQDRLIPLMDELVLLHSEYMRGGHGEQSGETRTRIEALEDELAERMADESCLLATSSRSVIWGVHFAEAMRRSPSGFDIVIANPPYGLKLEIARSPEYRLGNKDSYGVFTVRAAHLLRDGGVFCYIMSDTWETIRTHRPLRAWIISNFEVRRLLQMPPDTFSATVNVCVLCAVHRPGLDQQAARLSADLHAVDLSHCLVATGEVERDFESLLHEEHPASPQSASYRYAIQLIIKYSGGDRSGLPFFVGSPKLFAFLRQDWPVKTEPVGLGSERRVPVRHVAMNGRDVPVARLGDLCEIAVGLQTGDNHYYLRQRPTVRGTYRRVDEQLVLNKDETADFAERYHRALRETGELIGIGPEDYGGKYLLPYDKGGESDAEGGWLPNYYVPTAYYIDWSEDAVWRLQTLTVADRKEEAGKDDDVTRADETQLASRIQNAPLYFTPGITFSRTGLYAPTFRAASSTVFETESSLISTDCLPVPVLLGILASLVARYILKVYIIHSVHAEIEALKDLPMAVPNASWCHHCTKLVESIMARQRAEPRYPYYLHEQREIDAMVYELYGLDEGDIEEVERWYCRRYPKLARAQGFGMSGSATSVDAPGRAVG